MTTETEKYQMGWNDILGNLRRASDATAQEKKAWCQQQRELADSGHAFGPTQNTDDYREGVADACAAFLAGEDMTYKGPEWVTEKMLSAEPG